MLDGYTAITEPQPHELSLNTLTGLIDYIKSEIDMDSMDQASQFVHVVNFNRVSLRTHLFGEWLQRSKLITCVSHDYPGTHWMPVEDFIIHLNSNFERSEDHDYLTRLVSGVKIGGDKTIKDNGATQTAVVKSGASLLEEVEIKPTFKLQPFRTFPEVDQPIVEFTFRLKQQGDEALCNLFESDGERWKLNTIHTIKKWIEGQLKEHKITMPVIA